MFRRATMTTLSALSTGSSISSSSSSVARRSISFLATPTTPPTSAGHVHAMLSPAEMEIAPHGMGPVQGWNGGGSRLSPVVPTHFMRDSARRQSFSYGDRDATGTEQRFSGVHNQGRLDTEALSSPLVQHAPLPDLNRQGLSAVQAVREQHVAEGVTYMTTHREHEIDGKRTRNCVGFATEILKATTGVDLHLHMHALHGNFGRQGPRGDTVGADPAGGGT